MSSEPRDFPFGDVVKSALEKIEYGFTVYQRWTCDHCKTRQDMDAPNKFFSLGVCERCGKVTDVKRKGCNYSAEMAMPKIKH